MRNDMNKQSFKLWVLLLLLLTSTGLFAQAEFNETIRFEADINDEGTLEFINRSFDTEIKTWNNNYVELQMNVQIKASKQADIDETLRAIRQIEIKGTSAKRSVNTVFWESMNSNTNRHKIKLKTGETVVLKKFDIETTLFIPKTISMDIDCKYADIEMESISGEADFKVYSGKLYCQSIGGSTSLDLRYSKAYMETMPEASINLYDSDIELTTCGNFTIESKYSKVEIENAGDMQFESYDDNYTIGKLGDTKGNAKYSEFDFGPSINLFFNFYDSNLNAKETGTVKGECKYSDINIVSANSVTIDKSYDDAFVLGPIGSFSCRESKYTEYAVASIDGDILLKGYDDTFKVEKISDNFNHINLEGKYSDFLLNIPENISFKILLDQKYGKIDYPSENFERKTYIKENSKLFMDASTKNYKEGDGRLVEIKGYDNKVVIVN